MSKNNRTFQGRARQGKAACCFQRKPVDRVPNFEILYEDQHVEKLLGRYAGNTLSYGGDPAKGQMLNRDGPCIQTIYIELCELIGQDAIMLDGGLWTPFKRKDENGNLIARIYRASQKQEGF